MADRFVIAACSRSGTTYMARLFKAAGLPVEHEIIFKPGKVYPWQGQIGEVSHAAAEHLDRIDDATVLIHQVRHPLRVVASWEAYLSNVWASFNDTYEGRLYPQLRACRTPIEAAMAYWVLHNRRIEAGPVVLRYRVEEVEVSLLRQIAVMIGAQIAPDQAAEAIETVPRDTNTMRDKTTRQPMRTLATDDLPTCLWRQPMIDMARKYGYPLEG